VATAWDKVAMKKKRVVRRPVEKDADLHFRVSLSLDHAIRAHAAREGRTVSDMARRLLERGLQTPPPSFGGPATEASQGERVLTQPGVVCPFEAIPASGLPVGGEAEIA
jgi:hypothetical protein